MKIMLSLRVAPKNHEFGEQYLHTAGLLFANFIRFVSISARIWLIAFNIPPNFKTNVPLESKFYSDRSAFNFKMGIHNSERGFVPIADIWLYRFQSPLLDVSRTFALSGRTDRACRLSELLGFHFPISFPADQMMKSSFLFWLTELEYFGNVLSNSRNVSSSNPSEIICV